MDLHLHLLVTNPSAACIWAFAGSRFDTSSKSFRLHSPSCYLCQSCVSEKIKRNQPSESPGHSGVLNLFFFLLLEDSSLLLKQRMILSPLSFTEVIFVCFVPNLHLR